MKTVADEWSILDRMIIRGGEYTPEEQREMKRSFYAGWLACLTTLREASDTEVFPGSETPAETQDRLMKEVLDFFKNMVEDMFQRAIEKA